MAGVKIEGLGAWVNLETGLVGKGCRVREGVVLSKPAITDASEGMDAAATEAIPPPAAAAPGAARDVL